MDASGAGRLNRSSPSCLNRSAQRIDFFHGLLGRARQRMHEGRGNTELVAILGTLADRVEQEMLAGELRPIAAAVAVPRLFDVRQGTDGDEVTELVERGTLLALGEELSSFMAGTDSQGGGDL